MKIKRPLTVAFLIGTTCLLHDVFGQGDKLQDGFYIEDNSGKTNLVLRTKEPDGNEHQFRVMVYTNLAVKGVSIYSITSSATAWQVQINVQCKDRAWTKDAFVLVVDGKPYFEIGKSGSIVGNTGIVFSGAVTVKVRKKAEAKFMLDRLRKRFGISTPTPDGSTTTR